MPHRNSSAIVPPASLRQTFVRAFKGLPFHNFERSVITRPRNPGVVGLYAFKPASFICERFSVTTDVMIVTRRRFRPQRVGWSTTLPPRRPNNNVVMRKAAGAGAAGAAAADAAKLLRRAHLSTQDASRERVTPSLFVRRAFEHDAYEFDAAETTTPSTSSIARRFQTPSSSSREARRHIFAPRNATTTADNDMTISLL